MRRLAKIFGWLLAAVLLAVATVPWWLGLAASGVGRALGATFERYERIGYSRFALNGVVVKRSTVTVRADRVESDTPSLWLWRRLTGKPGEVSVNQWDVTVVERTPPSPPTADSGWTQLQPRLRRIAAALDRWLPRATLGPGSVHWRNGGLVLASGVWSSRTLAIKELAALVGTNPVPSNWPRADVTAAFPTTAASITATLHDLVFDETLTIESVGPEVSGSVEWQRQRAALKAHFPAVGWIPDSGSFEALDWLVPGARLKLQEAYASVRGDARVRWGDEKIQVDVNAKSAPAQEKKAPPLDVQLRGQGDFAAFTVEALHVALPGITALLNGPVTIGRDGQLKSGPAHFTLAADLAQQPWFKATGKVDGAMDVVPGAAVTPIADFRLTARDVTIEDWSIASLETKGRFDWPRLQIESGTLVRGAGERLVFQGGWDLRTHEIFAATLSGQVRRELFKQWLPDQPGFDLVSIDARAAGPLATVAHGGSIKADAVTITPFKPIAFSGEWTGTGISIDHFDAKALLSGTAITAAGSLNRDGLRLEKLVLAQGGAERLHLREPATVLWKPQVAVQSLHLVGDQAAVDADLVWGKTGRIDARVHELPSDWLSDLFALPGKAWRVSDLQAKGSWNAGPLELSLSGGAVFELGSNRQAEISLVAAANKDGIRIESLRAAEGASPVVTAKGQFGMIVQPGQTPIVKIAPDSALSLEAVTEPNAAFWQRLKDLSGLELKDPQVTARLSGTWAKPQGDVRMQAARVSADPARFPRAFPAVEALDLHLTGDMAGVNLELFSVNIEGQAVKAAGKLAVKEGNWGELFANPMLVARRDTDLHLEIPDAELAPLARYVPGYLAPQGRLHADLKFAAGGTWNGRLTLRDAASRPLGPLGILQEISADVRLVGYTMELEAVTAKAGGQPVTLSGKVELPVDGEPKYDLALKGENLPFVRQTGLLLRGDLDLKLQTPANAPGRISGSVQLRDSLFLEDVRSMIPGGPRGASRRPPYFSVETPPLNRFQLDVDVRGQGFMRMRTTVFNGVTSARFHLSGTLGEPRAIGEATIDQGQVLLPFATFEVQQGRVSLTEAEPFEPQLFVSGTSRRYGYDVRMELSGGASSPNLVFTSSPPLDSEQVLLMVMAGETPRNEVTYTGNQRFARIGTFLGQSLLNNLGGNAAGSDRLSISTGDNVSRQGRETYNIEYELNPRWSVVGEYDEFDDYNAGVKWRFYSKGGKDDAKK